jgi:DNA repair protein RecN (Recombination protein N)
MISYLSISNLSVIEKISVEFDNGLNIITGETGAGKSVLIGAISLLIGDRFNKTMFRNPDKVVTVEAIVNGDFSDMPDEFKDREYSFKDGKITIKDDDEMVGTVDRDLPYEYQMDRVKEVK